jgi:ATP-binding cassette subfamily B protein
MNRPSNDLTLLRRLLAHARPHWPAIGGLFLWDLLAVPLALLVPVPLKLVVDSVLGDAPAPAALRALLPSDGSGALVESRGALLVAAIALVLAIALLRQLQELASAVAHSVLGERLVLQFRAALFRHVQRLSLAYHDAQGSADSAYRVQYDAPAIQYVAIDGLPPLIASVVTVVGMLIVTARIDAPLAVVALSICPVLVLLTRAWRRPLRVRYRDLKTVDASAMSVVQETLGAIRVVKAFGAEAREHSRYVERSDQRLRAKVRLTLLQGAFDLLVGLTTAAGTAAVLWVGVRHVQAARLTLGELLVVMSYLAQLYAPLRTLSTKSADIQSSMVSAERALALLDERPDVVERPHARALPRATGAVELREVSFAYEASRPVLRGVTCSIAAGTRVGIAGPTGAGKTTLISLLARFYDPTAGAILLDGVDLRDLRLDDLRRQFSFVLQEPVLFSTTIAENIAYGRPGATERDIVAAATAAHAHEFISRLSGGYETQVGERGGMLSGGERQRISLARAFLKDAPILVLDEPTSAVDVGTEAVIIRAMDALMRGRTTFMIAHRLSTLQRCDVILVLEQGRLVRRGPPEEVLPGIASPAALGLAPEPRR